MDGSYPRSLRVWDAISLAAMTQSTQQGVERGGTGHAAPPEQAVEWQLRESLAPPGSKVKPEAGAEPYSLAWFTHVEKLRHRRYARWIPSLLEFTKHSGESLLGLGTGLGTDWAQYAAQGASMTVCCSDPHSLALTRRNFELRGLSGRFLRTTPTALPVESASIDVFCISQLVAGPETGAIVDEIHRVLRPGGKVLALAPALYDIDHLLKRCFPWQPWMHAAASAGIPDANRFTVKSLRSLFSRFSERRVHKRHLRRRELPHLARWLPLPLLERWMGHYLILKAFKPVSAVLPAAVAA